MDMSVIKIYVRVMVKNCYEDENGIFMETDDGFVLKYVGEYDLHFVKNKAGVGNEITIGTDPANECFALVEDIAKYSLR